MTWNHRVCERYGEYEIYEVYYDDNDEPNYVTMEPVSPSGDCIEHLKEDLAIYSQAINKPVLVWEEIGR